MASFVDMMKKLNEQDGAHLAAKFPFADILQPARGGAGEESTEGRPDRQEGEDELMHDLVAELAPEEVAGDVVAVEEIAVEEGAAEKSAAQEPAVDAAAEADVLLEQVFGEKAEEAPSEADEDALGGLELPAETEAAAADGALVEQVQQETEPEETPVAEVSEGYGDDDTSADELLARVMASAEKEAERGAAAEVAEERESDEGEEIPEGAETVAQAEGAALAEGSAEGPTPVEAAEVTSLEEPSVEEAAEVAAAAEAGGEVEVASAAETVPEEEAPKAAAEEQPATEEELDEAVVAKAMMALEEAEASTGDGTDGPDKAAEILPETEDVGEERADLIDAREPVEGAPETPEEPLLEEVAAEASEESVADMDAEAESPAVAEETPQEEDPAPEGVGPIEEPQAEAEEEVEEEQAVPAAEDVAEEVQAVAAPDSQEGEETEGDEAVEESRTDANGLADSDDLDVEAILAQVTGEGRQNIDAGGDEAPQEVKEPAVEETKAAPRSEAADSATAQGAEEKLTEQDETALRTLFGSEDGEAPSEEGGESDAELSEELVAQARAGAAPDLSEQDLFQRMTAGGSVFAGAGSVAVAHGRRGVKISADSLAAWAAKLIQPDLPAPLLWAFGILGAVTIAALAAAVVLEFLRG